MNLQYWRDPQKISQRVARKVLELADYDIKIHHLRGSANMGELTRYPGDWTLTKERGTMRAWWYYLTHSLHDQ